MSLTDWEKKTLNEIREWEDHLLNYEANDFQLLYHKYTEQTFSLLPDAIQQQFFSSVDNGLFHMHAVMQGSQLQLEAKEHLLAAGRIFNPEIKSIEDLKKLELNQLQYIAEQQIAKHRLYSLIQGGITGTGKTLFLGMDIPVMAVIHLRVVQLIAMCYGFEVNTPFEMMASLKIFHIAILPPRIQKAYWKYLMEEIVDNENEYIYQGKDQITDVNWLEQPIQQLVKTLAIVLFRNKKLQGIPLVSIAIGAGVNYRLTKKVIKFAQNFYQLRYLQEKEGKENEYTGT